MASSKRLRIGFVGSGFMTGFHLDSLQYVRDADATGIYSPIEPQRNEAAKRARDMGLGDTKAYASLAEMAGSGEVDALWVVTPNYTRVEVLEEIVDLYKAGKTGIKAVACEKPLARTVAEAKRMVDLIESTDLNHAYLENQLFAPTVCRGRDILWRRAVPIAGRPYLARCAEEHAGPHMAWFWNARRQGGGVLSDMLCHSVEVARFLLTEPGKPRNSLVPKTVNAQIACLKWARPEYAKQLHDQFGGEVDYRNAPAEDFARGSIAFESEDGQTALVESTTSWSFVGAGLRLSMEMLGPEYAMQINTLNTDMQLFLSRKVQGEAGEDLVEKQNAETGLMPVLENESAAYGYTDENRHVARAFLAGEKPLLTFQDGLEVVRLLMACYMSAEQSRTVPFPPDGLDEFVPAVAKETWDPRSILQA